MMDDGILEFMEKKSVLITGGVGFFGKVLTEKLLRSCPGIENIYLIIRSKFGKTANERWRDASKNETLEDVLKNEELFEILLKDKPNIMSEKVVVLEGDMSLINFGLTEDVLEELKNKVNIIFHSAATVRFNDPLHKAFLANTRGTLEMCKLGTQMNNLKCFVHVSTTYCNHDLKESKIFEKVYEPYHDWRTVLKLVETEDPAVINVLSYKILKNHPNTYTFSKSLSEKIIEDYSGQIPMVISRPSVVVSTLEDPIPGWTDNLNGVLGVTAGVTKGVLRVLKGREDGELDYVPVDYAINTLIVSAWDKARGSEKTELSVYNCAYADSLTLTFGELSSIGLEVNERYPSSCEFWYPFLILTTNEFIFRILFFFLNILPGFIVDSFLVLLNKKTRLTKLHIKIYQANQALSAFTTQECMFENSNFKKLWSRLYQKDAKTFPLESIKNASLVEILEKMQAGVKKHIFNEKVEDIEFYRTKLRRFYYLDRFVRGILIYLVLYSLYEIIIKYKLHT